MPEFEAEPAEFAVVAETVKANHMAKRRVGV